jgi:hypothetical protein
VDSAMATALKSFLNSPVGPKTSHFWGPVANWGFVIAGLVDMNKPAEMISGNMTGGRCNNWSLVSQFLFYHWSHQSIKPSLMLMFLCSNVCVFWTLHEVCMDGTTAKLLASSMPCF